MSVLQAFKREARFMMRDHSVLSWTFVVFSFALLSVWFGIVEVTHQHATIEQLREADRLERKAQLLPQKDWGSAAYYSFHLTYDPPSDFAFAALGQRDFQAWKHRIRMLALEGQIYERDAGNPVIALIGRFDFAFLAAFLVPLVLIKLLYDLKAGERVAGRHDLLEATGRSGTSLWLIRASLRGGAVLISLITPLVFAGIVAGTKVITLMLACLILSAYVTFWTLLCHWIAGWRQPGAAILMSLIGVWLSLSVIVPTAARIIIDSVVPTPSGAEILMSQRETVNDAWELPKSITMQAFLERHPEWSDYEPGESSFEWPWYYAFQQVGDQKTEPLSNAYRAGRLGRDDLAQWASLLAPPSLLERAFQTLARTDLKSVIAYEDGVRAYPAELRGFYYPRFFLNAPFDSSSLEELPRFEPSQHAIQ